MVEKLQKSPNIIVNDMLDSVAKSKFLTRDLSDKRITFLKHQPF
jgi:hypothetical protein